MRRIQHASLRTSVRIAFGVAPTAILIPISLVRRTTFCDMVA